MLARVIALAEARPASEVIVMFLVPMEFVDDTNMKVGGVFDLSLPPKRERPTPKIRADLRRKERAKRKR